MTPASGESFVSWLDRLGVEMRLPVGVVVDQLGMEMQGGGAYRAPELFGIALPTRSRVGVRAATGVAGEVLGRMHLSAYDGTVLDLGGLGDGDQVSVQTLRQREWALFLSSRACPESLVDSGDVVAVRRRCRLSCASVRVAERLSRVRNGVSARQPQAPSSPFARCDAAADVLQQPGQ